MRGWRLVNICFVPPKTLKTFQLRGFVLSLGTINPKYRNTMILLETNNRILEECLRQRLEGCVLRRIWTEGKELTYSYPGDEMSWM